MLQAVEPQNTQAILLPCGPHRNIIHNYFMRITDIILFFVVLTVTVIIVRVARSKRRARKAAATAKHQATGKTNPAAKTIHKQVEYSIQTSIPETSPSTISQQVNKTLAPRIKKHLLVYGAYYIPLIFSFISYLALYNIPKAIQSQEVTIYRFVQYTMLSILPGITIFTLRPAKLIADYLWSWVVASVLLCIFFGLGASIIFMCGFGLFNTFAFLVHLVIAILISYRLVALSIVVISAIGIVIFHKAFSDFLGHVITDDMQVPFLIGYWQLILSSLYLSFVQYRYREERMKPRPGKFFKKYIPRKERKKMYSDAAQES